LLIPWVIGAPHGWAQWSCVEIRCDVLILLKRLT